MYAKITLKEFIKQNKTNNLEVKIKEYVIDELPSLPRV